MSYEIVKGLKLKKATKEVWIKSDSSNVFPKQYHWWVSKTFSRIFKEQGEIAVKKAILIEYYKGNFQKSNNIYENSLVLLDTTKYNWDIEVSDEELGEVLYENYLKYKNREIGKFVIYKISKKLYISKFKKHCCYLNSKEYAKIFKSKEEAMIALQNYSNDFEIQKI